MRTGRTVLLTASDSPAAAEALVLRVGAVEGGPANEVLDELTVCASNGGRVRAILRAGAGGRRRSELLAQPQRRSSGADELDGGADRRRGFR